MVVYLSDCQAGAAAGCVAGSNANPGTQASPKRDLSAVDLSSLPAGSQVLFKRGGAWSPGGNIRINNPYASASAPLTLDAWGSGAAPVLRATIEFGQYQDTLDDGGYVLRNFKLEGAGNNENSFGLWFRDSVHDIVIENVEVTGFGLGIHFQGDSAPYVRNVTVRNSNVHHNLVQGIHGKAFNALYEGNLIELNNGQSGGSNRNHGMYLSGGNNIRVLNNRFIRNSRDASGTCLGGNMTFHGQTDGLLVEGNLIEQDRGSCYGISITAGYLTPEYFRNAVVRNNTVVNTGACAICVGSAPGVVIESNRVFNTQSGVNQSILWLPASGGGDSPGDAGNDGAIVRNNILCGTGSLGSVSSAGSTIIGNLLRTAADALTGACAR